MQKLGQHFLKNASVLQTIAEEAAIKKGDRIIEIGPGHGELTVPLLEIAKKMGATITCLEKDQKLIPNLQQMSGKESAGVLTIVEGDALTLLSDMTADTIIGNIPYYITGKLLRVISEMENKPRRVVLLIQKEVAERVCAGAPEMNRLAASVQFWAEASIVAIVPRTDFTPPPDVDSAIIVLETKPEMLKNARKSSKVIDPMLYYRAVRGIFAQPRKTLLNNVTAMASDKHEKGKISDQMKKIGIDPESRPQDLTIEQVIAIANETLWG